MPSTYPPPTIFPPPSGTHRNTLILLHGTSTSGPTFSSTLLSFPFPFPPHGSPPSPNHTLQQLLPHTRLVFPTGALRPTTVFGGNITNAWFDIPSFEDRTVGEELQIDGIRESVSYLSLLVKEEIAFLKSRTLPLSQDDEGRGDAEGKVALLGFSQGAALLSMALLSGELHNVNVDVGKDVGAWVGMSGWVPFRKQILEAARAASASLPDTAGVKTIYKARRRGARDFLRGVLDMSEIDGEGGTKGGENVWLGHGGEDVKVRLSWGEEGRDLLREVGVDVTWKVYGGLAHWYGEGEMGDLVEFLEGTLGGGL